MSWVIFIILLTWLEGSVYHDLDVSNEDAVIVVLDLSWVERFMEDLEETNEGFLFAREGSIVSLLCVDLFLAQENLINV